MKEHRSYKRYDTGIKTIVVGETSSVEHKTVNVSVGGFCITSTQPYEKGQNQRTLALS